MALFVQDDNEGPPTEAQLHHYWNQTRLMFPNATKIISTTYESFFDELAKVKHLLPVVTKEIGDTVSVITLNLRSFISMTAYAG